MGYPKRDTRPQRREKRPGKHRQTPLRNGSSQTFNTIGNSPMTLKPATRPGAQSQSPV